MERLTEKTENGYALKIPKDKNISDLEIKFNVYDKLGAYEDAEEQGLLLRLPFQIGDKVFVKIKNEIREDYIEDYDIWSVKDGLHLRIRVRNHNNYIVGMLNKDIFKTKEEAEKALADMGV